MLGLPSAANAGADDADATVLVPPPSAHLDPESDRPRDPRRAAIDPEATVLTPHTRAADPDATVLTPTRAQPMRTPRSWRRRLAR
jgi:hypothetical protein